MIKQLKHIILGWGKRLGILQVTPIEEVIAEERMKICRLCPRSKESKLLKIIKGQALHDHVIVCSLCGCPCEEKTIVVNEKCPEGKWS